MNTYEIPILTYSFGIINWTQTELQALQTKINTAFTRHRKHHPKSAVERLILPRKEGGRGLIDIKTLHNTQIDTLRKYFHGKTTNSLLHKAITLADNNYTPLHLGTMDYQLPLKTSEDKILTKKQKALHGRHPHEVSQLLGVVRVAHLCWIVP